VLVGYDWLRTARAYLALSLPLHLVWESAQLPLYTIWSTGTLYEKAFAVVHCTAGDLMIASLTLLAALVLAGSAGWPSERANPVFTLTLMFGIGYTIFSEWLNVGVRRSWAYAPFMPVLPFIRTGLSPLLQWVVLPAIALRLATHPPSGFRKPGGS
jgi:hypothetical protein